MIKKDYGFYGTIYEYEPDSPQAILEFVSSNQHEVDVKQFKAGQNREFIKNWVMFFCVDDHLTMIQSSTAGNNLLEAYFDLISKKAEIIEQDEYIRIRTQFDVEKVGKNLSKLKSIEIGSAVLSPKRPVASGSVVETEVDRGLKGDSKALSVGEAINVLVNFFGLAKLQAEKMVSDLPDDAILNLKSKLSVRTKNYQWKDQFVSDVQTALVGQDRRDVKLNTSQGMVRGDQATLIDVQKIPDVGGIPELNKAWEVLKKVYERWRDDDKLEA